MDVQTEERADHRADRWPTFAIVFGALGVLFSALIVPGILAIAFGVMARRRGAGPSKQATAGIVLGALSIVAGLAVWAVYWDKIFESPSYRTLRVGDCYERPGSDARYVQRQSCDGEHGREVIAVLEHPAAIEVDFPGVETITRDTNPSCQAAAEAYIGRPLDQAPVRVFRILPSRESWNDGNRRVVCSLGSRDRAPLVGSLRNRQSATG